MCIRDRYSSTSAAGQVVFGVPLTENDSISVVFGIDRNQILAYPGASPQSVVDYIDAFGKSTFHSWRTELGWARDTRNDFYAPSYGTYQRASAEITLPGSTAEYYKLNYESVSYTHLDVYKRQNRNSASPSPLKPQWPACQAWTTAARSHATACRRSR